LIGLQAKEIVGKKYRNIIYKEDVKIADEYFTKVINGESQYANTELLA